MLFRSIRLSFVIILLLFLLPAACRDNGLKTVEVRMKGKTVKIEVALTQEEKENGLMYRRSLGADEGMIFVYDRDQRMYFWMKNTYIPLSVAFITADGEILQIEDMQPLDEKTIESRFSVRYAIEANQGAFARWGVAVGDKIEFPAGFPK
jgi:uncharacterized protein